MKLCYRNIFPRGRCWKWCYGVFIDVKSGDNRMHYSCHLYPLGCIVSVFVFSMDQLVDIFTKILSRSTFTGLRHHIGVGDFPFRGDVLL
jgi:hypothetical protein